MRRVILHGKLLPNLIWSRTLRLVKQANVIRREYMNGAAVRVIRCRHAMVSYLLQELCVAVSPQVEFPPSYQLALVDDKPVALLGLTVPCPIRWVFLRPLKNCNFVHINVFKQVN